MPSKKKPKKKSRKTVVPEIAPVNLEPAPRALPKANNFWNCCPLEMDELPSSPCPLGKPTFDERGKLIEPQCPWWINSKEHNYCFWRWLKSNSMSNGRMDPLTQKEIADLLCSNPTDIHHTIKGAVQKIRDSGFAYVLEEFAKHELHPEQGDDGIYNLPIEKDFSGAGDDSDL